jgi:threonine dehydrogenase-like Zn-dependent dehydrogenase
MQDGALLVRGMGVGICGTDREIAEGACGTPPSGEARLVIGHEGLGEVLEAPPGSGFAPGDLVVGIVRRPDPVPCPACAAGEWDMCRTSGAGSANVLLVSENREVLGCLRLSDLGLSESMFGSSQMCRGFVRCASPLPRDWVRPARSHRVGSAEIKVTGPV